MTGNLETQVIEAEARLRQAVMHHDISALEELLAPELIFTNHMGELVNKEDDLNFHRAALLNLTQFEPSQGQIQLHSDYAVVSVLMHLVGTFQNAPIDQRIRFTRVWSLMPSGSVQMVTGHSSEVH